MLFSVLTRKDKVPRFNFSPPRSRPWLRGGGSLRRPVTLPESIRPAPSLGLPAGAQAQLSRQISAGGALSARSPDHAQPSSLREPGAQEPAGPQAPQATQTGAGSRGLRPMETAAGIRPQRWEWGRGSLLLQGLSPASGRPWRGLWSSAGHVPSLSLGLPAQPPARGRRAWGAPERRPRSASHCTLLRGPLRVTTVCANS